MGTDHLEDFWNASELNGLNFAEFANRIANHDPEPEVVDPLAGSEVPHPLPLKRDRLQRRFESRRSAREFSPATLSEKTLGQLLGSISAVGPNQRLYPSAGGVGGVEVFALLDRVESPLGRRAIRYLPGQHALSPVRGQLPPPEELDRLCSLEGSAPPLILLIAVRLDLMRAKYGDRAGRFALIEVGHACQNLALRIAEDDLAGYQLGGVLDGDLEELLHLRSTPARITLGYAIGHPA